MEGEEPYEGSLQRLIQIRHERIMERRKKGRISFLKARYNITLEQYNSTAEKQNFKCAICGKPDGVGTLTSKRLAVDHCHRSNKIRGLLCYNCNSGLGHFKDSLGNLRNAMQYLLDH